MARPLRLSIENGVYHIMSRGIRKENIFNSERDKYVFIDKMNETFNKYSFVCYAFCLMDNHYHLFLKTLLANISEGMHFLNASYATWFRTKYKLTGGLFQGRYKSVIVDADSYAMVLSAYIHLNPLRAGLVDKLDDYPFSSYLDYTGKRESMIENTNIDFILGRLSNKKEEAILKYKDFIEENISLKNPLENSYKGIALGNSRFIDEIKERVKHHNKNREINHIKSMSGIDADYIIDAMSECFEIDKSIIFESSKKNLYRQLAIYLIKKYTVLKLREIGNMFKIDYTSVSVASKRFEEKIKEDKKSAMALRKVVKKMREGIECQM